MRIRTDLSSNSHGKIRTEMFCPIYMYRHMPTILHKTNWETCSYDLTCWNFMKSYHNSETFRRTQSSRFLKHSQIISSGSPAPLQKAAFQDVSGHVCMEHVCWRFLFSLGFNLVCCDVLDPTSNPADFLQDWETKFVSAHSTQHIIARSVQNDHFIAQKIAEVSYEFFVGCTS